MKSLRAEALNVLLCLMLGAAIGGVVSMGLRGKPVAQGFDAEPMITLEDDPGLQAMERIDDLSQRRHALFNVMSRFAVSDLNRALETLPGDASHDDVLSQWVEERLLRWRPDLATRASAAMHDVSRRDDLSVVCAHGWRRIDSAKTAQWLRDHLTESLATKLTATAMEDDPAFLGRLLLAATNVPGAEANLTALLREWMRVDAADAQRFMETMPPARISPVLINGLGTEVLKVPEPRLRSWLKDLPVDTQQACVAECLEALPLTTSMADARRWCSWASPIEFSGAPVIRWFERLTTLSPTQAQTALEMLTPNWAQDDCVEGCVQALSTRDRSLALDWSQDIRDEARRHRVASEVWLGWAFEDYAAANAEMDTDANPWGFSKKEAEQLRQQFRKGGGR